MGRTAIQLTAYATLSRHFSDADRADNHAWNQFVWGVQLPAEESDLFIDVSAETFDDDELQS